MGKHVRIVSVQRPALAGDLLIPIPGWLQLLFCKFTGLGCPTLVEVKED